MGLCVGSKLHHPCQRHIYPSVAPAPIAVLIGLGKVFIGWVVLIITIPQTSFGIEQRTATPFFRTTVLIARVGVFGVHALPIVGIARDTAQPCIDGHGHLYGIYPVPVGLVVGFHQFVDALLHVRQSLRLCFIHQIQIYVRLSAAQEIGIMQLAVATRLPLMKLSPVYGILQPIGALLFSVDIEQSFIEHASGPYPAVTLFSAHIAVGTHIGSRVHKILCHILGGVHHRIR